MPCISNAYRGCRVQPFRSPSEIAPILYTPRFRQPEPEYRHWTTQEDATLLLCRAEGWSFVRIGMKMGRTRNSCISRFSRLVPA